MNSYVDLEPLFNFIPIKGDHLNPTFSKTCCHCSEFRKQELQVKDPKPMELWKDSTEPLSTC